VGGFCRRKVTPAVHFFAFREIITMLFRIIKGSIADAFFQFKC